MDGRGLGARPARVAGPGLSSTAPSGVCLRVPRPERFIG